MAENDTAPTLAAFCRHARRFQGFSVDFRRDVANWPGCWRVRICSSKGGNPRLTAYGDTLEQAVDDILGQLGSWQASYDGGVSEAPTKPASPDDP